MPYGQLEITIAEGRKLKETGSYDKADFYVSLSLDKQYKQKTHARSEVIWNEKFLFDVLEGRNDVFLEVFDRNVASDELIGGATVPLNPVFQQGYAEIWANITRPSGKPAGEIRLLMNFKDQGPTSGPPGHTPYPVPDGSSYFSPPNSARSNTPPSGSPYQGHAGYQPQQQAFGSFGPEGGALPIGYGSGTPPPVKLPNSTGSPLYPTTGGGFPDPSSYISNMPGQAQSYYQQQPSSVKTADKKEKHEKDEKKDKKDKHKDEKKEKHEKDEKKDKKDKHKDEEKKEKHVKDEKKDKKDKHKDEEKKEKYEKDEKKDKKDKDEKYKDEKKEKYEKDEKKKKDKDEKKEKYEKDEKKDKKDKDEKKEKKKDKVH